MFENYRDPVRNVNNEFLAGLEVVSNKIYPLPGATGERIGDCDSRLTQLRIMSNIPRTSKICYYEHIATVRDRKTNKFFVAFRQTMDALLEEFKDPTKYPEWLMKSDMKRAELKTYIYMVKERDGQPLLPRNIPIIRTHEDWLEHVTLEWAFDTLAYYLMKNSVISLDMYTKMK